MGGNMSDCPRLEGLSFVGQRLGEQKRKGKMVYPNGKVKSIEKQRVRPRTCQWFY